MAFRDLAGGLSHRFGTRVTFRGVAQVWGVFLVMLGVSASLARADAVVYDAASVAPNIAEVRIEPEGVHVSLEVYIGNLGAFADLLPDDWLSKVPDRPGLAERLDRFAETGISIRDDSGRALPLSIRLLERRIRVDRASPLAGQKDPLSGQTIPAPPDDPRVAFFELFYTFDETRPDALIFSPPTPVGDVPAMAVGMIAFDRDVILSGFNFLAEDTRLVIDWDDPWYTKFDNPNITRRHKSGLSTFLYVEPREVRHETLIRVRDLEAWMDVRFASGDVLAPDAQVRLVDSVVTAVAARNPVRIDGVPQVSAEQYGRVLTLDETGLQIVEDDKTVRADAAFVGIVLSFPRQTLPDRVAVAWDMFSDRYTRVPATLYDAAGPFISGAQPDDPDIVWTNHLLTYQNPAVRPVETGTAGKLNVPVLSVAGVALALAAGLTLLFSRGVHRIMAAGVAVAGLAGAVLARDMVSVFVPDPFRSTPDTAQATLAFGALLENVNTATLEITPEARAQQLAPVVSKAALPDVAAEIERALAIRIPAGGLARITRLRDLSLSELSPLAEGFGFQALAAWSAEANAGHWGHDHRRLVDYRALIEVVDDHGNWKIDGITILEVKSPNV